MSDTKPSTVKKAKESQQELPLALSEELGKESTLDAIVSHYNSWLPKYQALAQGRSNFQIEKMIATEHATPVASYQHTLFQLRVLHQALIADFVNGIERTREFEYKWQDKPHDKPQWWENGQGHKKLTWYDTDKLKHEHEIQELKMSVKDKLLQLETFTKVLTAMEEKHQKPFTQKELNAEEPEYWKLRLAQQMSDSYLDRQTGLGTGNIKSLRMALAESPVRESLNKVTDFPDLFNAVLSDRDSAMEVLNDLNERLFGEMNTLGTTPAPPAAKNQLATSKPTPTEPPLAAAHAADEQTEKLQRLRELGIRLAETDE